MIFFLTNARLVTPAYVRWLADVHSAVLVDNENQANKFANARNRPNDNVTGYTMANLCKIALKSYGLPSLKSSLKKEKPTGVTDEQIDLLFTKYELIWN